MPDVIASQSVGAADNDLCTHINACLHELVERGYSPLTVRCYRSSLAHFAYWLNKKKLAWSEINEALVRGFITTHLPACDCRGRYQRNGVALLAALNHLLGYLRAQGHITAKATDKDVMEEEVRRYDAYLDKTCGLAFKTRQVRKYLIRRFLAERFVRCSADLSIGEPREIREYVMHATQGWTRGSTAVLCGALRSYLRFRAFQGGSTEAFMAAIPTVARWPGESLPSVLTAKEVERFLGAFDCRSVVGSRNYAIARCLVDLGLRAGEVAALAIDDFNWHAGTLQLKRTKGKRIDTLPLPAVTGEAIVAYLLRRTIARTERALFVRQQAPFDKPFTVEIVSYAMRQAYVRSGITKPWGGTHCLRHSLACRLVNAGVPVKEIADVLRHRNLNTTMTYARVNVAHLSAVAMPWPGRMS